MAPQRPNKPLRPASPLPHPWGPSHPTRPQPPRPVSRPAASPAQRPVRPQPPSPVTSTALNHGALDGHRKAFPVTAALPARQPAGTPVLHVIIGTWLEGDVIEATVHNCFANGASRVFLVDNASPDDTRERAAAAGAELSRNYRTDFYDDDLRLRLMNEVMVEVSGQEPRPEAWWLFLDADEFPCGPQGQRLLDYLAGLAEPFNTVGAVAVDLYPTGQPCFGRDRHPADFMSHGTRRAAGRGTFCKHGHWKHPLIKVSNGEVGLSQSRGAHVPFALEETDYPVEPPQPILLFHAPFRLREHAERRLRALCEKQADLGGQNRGAGDDVVTGNHGSVKRWRSLEAVYRGEWDKVEMAHSQQFGRHVVGVALYPWRRLVPFASFPRWYEVAAAADPVPGRLGLAVLPAPPS